MKCPFCDVDMIKGWLSSTHNILWTQNERKMTGWKGKGDIKFEKSYNRQPFAEIPRQQNKDNKPSRV